MSQKYFASRSSMRANERIDPRHHRVLSPGSRGAWLLSRSKKSGMCPSVSLHVCYAVGSIAMGLQCHPVLTWDRRPRRDPPAPTHTSSFAWDSPIQGGQGEHKGWYSDSRSPGFRFVVFLLGLFFLEVFVSGFLFFKINK